MRSVAKEGNVEFLQFDDVLYVPMLAMLTPFEVVAVTAIAVAAGNVVARRSPVKAVFNVGSHLLAAVAGILIATALGYAPSVTPGMTDVLAAMVGALAMTAVTALLVR